MKLIAVLCIVGWRVFWLTMMNRVGPGRRARRRPDRAETALLDRLVPDRDPTRRASGTWPATSKVARLGGYLARAGDPPPGDVVMWRGMARLTDIVLGATLALRDVGN